MNRVLISSPPFIRAAKRFVKSDKRIADAIRQALARLEADPFDSRLRTHKLKGSHAGSWSASAGYDLRIVFEFVEHEGSEALLLVSVGTHDHIC